ncbi:MAG: ATP-dependent zinc protease [Burkholderiaceae bacterium]
MRLSGLLSSLLVPCLAGLGSVDAAACGSGRRGRRRVYVENAWFNDKTFALGAKLDSGAKTSSIDSANAEKFEQNGKSWYRVHLVDADGIRRTVEGPVVRDVVIRRAGAARQRRAVISLQVCVAGQSGEAEFTLADRTGQDYPVLIGRSFMAKRILIDSGATHLHDAACRNGAR